MGLGSVLRTAQTAASAAEASIGVVANNLANLDTKGFKASRPNFTTQRPRTHGLGSALSGSNGGTNPTQVGNGVRLGAIGQGFSQGTLAMSGDVLGLGIQGDGMFILEGRGRGGRNYTRDGQFQLNGNGEIVSGSGQRVLGFAADDNFRINGNTLSPLRIPLGKQIRGINGQVATLNSYNITEDGRISGRFTDGVARNLGQIGVAKFINPAGLSQQGNTAYAPTASSGLPIEGVVGDGNHMGMSLLGGAVEQSNTDIGQSLIDLNEAANQFLAGLAVMDAADEVLEESFDVLLGLSRK